MLLFRFLSKNRNEFRENLTNFLPIYNNKIAPENLKHEQ